MEKFLPPLDFFKYNPEKNIVPINEIRRKLIDSELLGKSFLVLHLNNPITCTGLTEELNRVFEKSYRQKTYRILCELSKLGVINFKKYCDVNQDNPNEHEKDIIRKQRLFLRKIKNPWESLYPNNVYYYISKKGEEVLEFVAEKYNFSKPLDG